MGFAWTVSEIIKHLLFSWLRSVSPWMKVKVNIINTWCIITSEAVTVPSLTMMTLIVSEESLVQETHAPTHPPTHTHTERERLRSSILKRIWGGQLLSLKGMNRVRARLLPWLCTSPRMAWQPKFHAEEYYSIIYKTHRKNYAAHTQRLALGWPSQNDPSP